MCNEPKGGHDLVKSLIYTINTRSCIMTSTGYYRLLYNQDRLLPTTNTRFTRLDKIPLNTRSCIMTSTGHNRLLIKGSPQELGLRSTGVGFSHSDPAVPLPTVRIIVPSSPRVLVGPSTTAQTIAERYVITGYSLIERITIFLFLAVYEHN